MEKAGSMVVFCNKSKIFKFLDGDNTILESAPLEKVTKIGEIRAYRHEGFWQCMDHKLDKDLLEKMIEKNQIPWIKK